MKQILLVCSQRERDESLRKRKRISETPEKKREDRERDGHFFFDVGLPHFWRTCEHENRKLFCIHHISYSLSLYCPTPFPFRP